MTTSNESPYRNKCWEHVGKMSDFVGSFMLKTLSDNVGISRGSQHVLLKNHEGWYIYAKIRYVGFMMGTCLGVG